MLHNKLTGEKGLEIILTTDGKNTVVAKCLEVQDINSYTLRDRSRPKRDSKAGMLPPKLAQIIINLATGNTAPSGKLTVLDPFCGTGVTLIEANLMGFSSLGSDLEQKMIANSQANLDWAKTSLNLPKNVTSDIENGDATRHKWRNPFIFVASEIYLGRPFTSPPDRSTLLDTIRACDIILAKFLKNISPQLTKDARLSLAVPAWFIKEQVYHLSTLDKLTQLGYNRIKFVHASQRELIYHRPGQFVARELVVLERIQDVKS